MTPDERERKELRTFGLLVGGIFAVIGLWPLVVRNEDARVWALVVGGGLMVPALLLPRSLKHVHRIWMTIGHALGWINTRILLGIIFYGLLTPMGVAMRLCGRSSIRLRFEPERDTYRVARTPRPRTHMTRQF